MHITALHLGFLCKFSNVSFPLTPVTTFVGTNRSGKSSVLVALGFLSLVMEHLSDDDGVIRSGLFLGSDDFRELADKVALGNSDLLARSWKENLQLGAEFPMDPLSLCPSEGLAHWITLTWLARPTKLRLLPPLNPTEDDQSSLADEIATHLWDGSNLDRVTSNIVYYLSQKHSKTFKLLEAII
ncbi:hypothetical protein HDU85_006840 [Gaertneriomyces sp. JEL0708]|nr:hypothetical protein HDU85_006840 [Gaertneriomyces sp. JEL0708]